MLATTKVCGTLRMSLAPWFFLYPGSRDPNRSRGPHATRDGELFRSGTSTHHQSLSTHVVLASPVVRPSAVAVWFCQLFTPKISHWPISDSSCVAVDPCSLVPSASDDSSIDEPWTVCCNQTCVDWTRAFRHDGRDPRDWPQKKSCGDQHVLEQSLHRNAPFAFTTCRGTVLE